MAEPRDLTQEEQDRLREAGRLTDSALQSWSERRYFETESPFKEALAIWTEVLGPDSKEAAVGLSNLAHLYHMQERYEEAVDLYRQAIAINETVYGSESRELLGDLYRLAQTYFQNEQYDEAYAPYERVLAIREMVFGEESPEVGDALMDLAHLYYYVGRYAESEPFDLRGLSLREEALGPAAVEVGYSCELLGRLYGLREELAKDPEPYYRRALAIYEKTLGQSHEDTVEVTYRLADYLGENGRHEEANALYASWLSRLEQIEDVDPDDISWMVSGYRDYLRGRGREDEAQAVADRWPEPDAYEEMTKDELEKRRRTLGPDHPDTVDSLSSLANSRFSEGDLA